MSNRIFFIRFLRFSGPLFFLVGLFHLSLGLGADILMGANISAQTRVDPGLDSQNRFYGVSLVLYGAILLLAATDLERYIPAVKLTLIALFVAGLARFVSVFLYGWPPFWISLLFVSEIIVPPLVMLWMSRLENEKA